MSDVIVDLIIGGVIFVGFPALLFWRTRPLIAIALFLGLFAWSGILNLVYPKTDPFDSVVHGVALLVYMLIAVIVANYLPKQPRR